MEMIKTKRVLISLTDSNLKKRQFELRSLAKTGDGATVPRKVQRIADAGHKGLSIEIRPCRPYPLHFSCGFSSPSKYLAIEVFVKIR